MLLFFIVFLFDLALCKTKLEEEHLTFDIGDDFFNLEEEIPSNNFIGKILSDSRKYRVLHARIKNIESLAKTEQTPIDEDYQLFPFEKGRKMLAGRKRVEFEVQEPVTDMQPAKYHIEPDDDAQAAQPITDEQYDYEKLKNELYPEYDVVTPSIDETLGETLGQIFDLSMPKNCTQEQERWSIGLKAFQCALVNLTANADNTIDRKQAIILLVTLIAVWIAIALAFAIVGWCHTGWFTCFRCPCRSLKPHKVHQEVREYLVYNKPGVIDLEDGGSEYYKATPEEQDAYIHLQETLQDF